MATTAQPHRVEPEILREVFELTAVGLVVMSPDGVFRLVNRAFCRMTGYEQQELEGRTYHGLVRPEDLDRDEEHMRTVRAGGEPPPLLDTRLVHKDGHEVWIRALTSVRRDAGGAARFIVSAVIDLSDSKETEQELERHLHFTRALLDAIPSPVYFKDGEGCITVHNRAWDEIFGGSSEGAGLHHERDRGLLERPSSTTSEAVATTAAGDQRQLLYNKVSFVDQEGTIAGLIGVITDVTRYKEAESALETSEARFRVLTESSLDLISVMDEDGTIRYQSPALRHLMGYDPTETVGQNVFDMIHRDDVDAARAAFERVI